MASPIDEQIKAIEEELLKTQYNKATQHHIGRLKAKMARLKSEQEKRRSASGGGGKGYSVKKSGNATVALVGFPSVGKSTLLNKLTNAESDVAAYAFTTIDVIPGIMYYNFAKIQILDLPGLIRDASKGKGRGREVLSVVRNADLILFVLDVYETNLETLQTELEATGIRLDKRPPDVVITKTDKGGIWIKTTVPLTKMDEELARDIVSEYGYINADVVIRQDVTEDELIDALTGNRLYMKSLVAVNKIDLVDKAYLKKIKDKLAGKHPVLVSADEDIGLEDLKKALTGSTGGETPAEGVMITRLRHKLALEKALARLREAQNCLTTGQSSEFAAFELSEALNALDEITGKNVPEDVLSRIFSSFCIGK